MRHALVSALAVCFVCALLTARPGAGQSSGGAAAAPIDEVLQAVRADLQSRRSDVLAKNLMLTPEQAERFWPVYDAYQKAQNAIMDEQLKGVQRYIESFDSLDDTGALGLINAHFDRDEKMNALRRKWLGEFRKVLGTKLAVRAMQIDRRLSLAYQLQMTAKIPLAH